MKKTKEELDEMLEEMRLRWLTMELITLVHETSESRDLNELSLRDRALSKITERHVGLALARLLTHSLEEMDERLNSSDRSSTGEENGRI